MVGDSWFVRVSVRPQQVATSRFWLVRQNRSTTYGFRQPTGQTRTPGIRHFVCEIALRGNDLAHFYRDTWRISTVRGAVCLRGVIVVVVFCLILPPKGCASLLAETLTLPKLVKNINAAKP